MDGTELFSIGQRRLAALLRFVAIEACVSFERAIILTF